MKKLMMTLGLLVAAVPAASAGAATTGTSTNVAVAGTTASGEMQRRGYYQNRRVRQEQRECRRELRRAENRRQFNRELRECNRELARARNSGRWQNWDRRWRRW